MGSSVVNHPDTCRRISTGQLRPKFININFSLFHMIKKEIEKKYGKALAKKILKSDMLIGITVKMRNGEMDIPESDIKLALKQIKGEKISDSEWD